jgi:glycosyltransferase involved in cell wall biosynthesis
MFRMSLHAFPHVRASGTKFGYAYAYQEIFKHFREYLYNGERLQVDLHSPKSKVQLYFGSPPGQFHQHQYKIQMTQWESTLVPPNWVDHARTYDEWWTANQFGADGFINAGVPAKKIYIYEHGVDGKTWTKKKRGQDDVIRFLHVDSGSPRKRADLAFAAFKAAFGNNLDYELTLKHSHYPESGADWFDEQVLRSRGDWDSPNVRHIKENMSLEQLVSLFQFHDVLLYPSEGEGFGLIPLQALATGMPVISTGVWCSYEEFFNGNIIDSTMGISPIIETYTRFGEVIIPNLDSIVDQLQKVAEDIKSQSDVFYSQADKVVEQYNWQKKTNAVLDSLVQRLGRENFNSCKEYLA